MQTLFIDEVDSPIGNIVVYSDGHALLHLDFTDCPDRIERLIGRRFKTYTVQSGTDPLQMKVRLQAYFDRNKKSFLGIKLNTGGTEFQKKVWQALQAIPYGSTVSYAQLAKSIGQPTAVRAVAGANALNPVSIMIPCHRVIASDGKLAGYAGGIDRKKWLLRHERAIK